MSSSNSNNQRGQQRVHEDLPEYRSVMMRPLVPPPMPRSFAPPEKLSRVAPTLSRGDSFPKPFLTPPQSPSWKIVEPVTLPAGYLLERTNSFIEDVNAQTVANRICSCLCEQSIASTTTNHDENENLLMAETQDCVKFAVRLFTSNGAVVVEIQRVCGCSFAFREAAKCVLRSAKGVQRISPQQRMNIPSTLPRRTPEVLKECVKDDFDIAYNMLQSERSDSQMLALESLEKMTMSSDAVDVAAKSVLSCECLKHMIVLLETHMDLALSEMEGSHSHLLRRKVLAVLANSCAALNQADLAEILSRSDHDLKTRSFLDMLLSTLREASERPHDAYQSARCLQSLLISKEVGEAMIEMRAIEVVSSACNAACHCHRALETESKKLIIQLRKVQC